MTKFADFLAETLETGFGKAEMITAIIMAVVGIAVGSWQNWVVGLSVAIFILSWGHVTYRAYSKAMAKVEALTAASKTSITPEDWADLARTYFKTGYNGLNQ